MRKGRLIAVWVDMAGIALAIQGGRNGEQSRPLTYDRSVYRGRSDRMLDDQHVEMPSQRTAG